MRGAFSLGIIAPDRLIAVRDPWGFRPLALGKLDGGYVISSESCAFDVLGAEFLREIAPGEMVVIDQNGVRSFFYAYSSRKAFCVFELIYFARPDSLVFGNSVYEARKKMGQKLAVREFAVADMVIPVPDSGMCAALGFAEFSGIPLELGFIRNPYVGRTFIRPRQDERELAIDIKLNPLKSLLQNKRVIIIEDSIVRGNTSRRRITTLKRAGVKEVHMRVSSPPHRFPCFYGVDFPSSSELVAFGKSVEEIRQYLGLDSLQYLDIEDLKEIVGNAGKDFCFACFNGDYPVRIEKEFAKNALEKV
jgi:amidophosphoribosyltransferase